MSIVRNSRLPHTYRDSVVLMELSRELNARAGVSEAAVIMGTPANLELLHASNLLSHISQEIAPDDVVIAVRASDVAQADAAIEWAVSALQSTGRPASPVEPASPDAESVRPNWRTVPPEVALALISTPGLYAAAEAWKALRAGRHVFIFSDHVPVEDEIALKQAGCERGTLVMGPECGTAILNGVPLGFANEIRRGTIGLVAASGSGLQELICLIDRFGGGITHAIGTGGRDLSAAVGGLATQQAIELLANDSATEMLVVLSKPLPPETAADVIERVRVAGKPAVVCFLGAEEPTSQTSDVTFARTLEDAARAAVERAGTTRIEIVDPTPPKLSGQPGLLRGLFSGGTLAYEAISILSETVGPIWSNRPLDPVHQLEGDASPDEHVCLDLGATEYTAGRPHPMIDATMRANLLLEQASDRRVGVILLDFVLGYGSHHDPAGTLLTAIQQAQQAAAASGRHLHIVASVTGTERDPQPRSEQVSKLEHSGVIVAPTNASAARTAARLLDHSFTSESEQLPGGSNAH